jgi:CBS domain containing-hemolysin-like protein
MVFGIFITILLVLLNGFFVAAEFAIVKVRSSQLALQTDSASKRAAQIVTNNLDGFLAATQLGITLASLGLGWVGEGVVSRIIMMLMKSIGLDISAELAHTIALPVAFIVITVLHIVFGELAPKSLAIRHATSTTLTVSIPLRIFYFAFKPFISALNGFANLMLKVIGIKPIKEQGEIHSEEELKFLVAESEEGGAIEESERELIQNVFDFDNRVVRQVMVPRMKITSINIDTPIGEAVNLVLREGYSRYPAYEKSPDHITGVFHSKDILKSFIEKGTEPLSAIVREPYFIPETKSLNKLLRDFQKMRIEMAFVVDEYGTTTGLITLEDIMEELVGEIQDEFDYETQIVIRKGSVWQVLATSALHDINKHLEKPLVEDEDYDTLAGMILYHKPLDLKEGQELILEGYKMKILKMKKTIPLIVEMSYIGKA